MVEKARRKGPSKTPVVLETRWWQDVVEKASTQQKTEPLGLRLSNPGERERHNADGHNSGGQYICSSVRSPTTSHTQTLSNPFRTLTIKWEVYIIPKKSSLVSLLCYIVTYADSHLYTCTYICRIIHNDTMITTDAWRKTQ